MWSERFCPFMRRYKMKFVKTQVLDQEKLRGILWTFVKFCKIVFPTFIYFHECYRDSANIRQHLTVYPSYFNNIYLKYFGILQNLIRTYEILWKFMKVDESWQKLTKVDESWWKLMKAMIFHDIFWSNHLLLFCFIQLQCTISIS